MAKYLIYLCFFVLVAFCCWMWFFREIDASVDYTGWAAYAGTPEGNRYSSNTQINKENVSRLEIAWRYSTHDKDSNNRSQIQVNPIVVDQVLYGVSPASKLFALNAATGEQKWMFDPRDRSDEVVHRTLRGVTYWEDATREDTRIFYTVGRNLYAIHAGNGKPVESFGQGGFISLAEHLNREIGDNAQIDGRTPGVIYKDLIIIGMRVSESQGAAPGHIRAFDVRTGERKWIFHTIPHPGEFGYDTWEDPDAWKKIGGANNWAGMALDEKRGIVYVPTGSASPDFYGGVRKGQNLFANSLIALDAATGEYIWHYQTIHHDLWDRDLPANPNLVTVKHQGKKIDAVAQITKHGYVFLLNRATGEPLFPIEEVPVPTKGLPGEKPWPTQPIPTLPEPFSRRKFEIEDVFGVTRESYENLLEKYRKIKHHSTFSPPSKEGVWIFPGFDGGGEWGGAAVDPRSGILYVNSSEIPWSLTMIDVPETHRDFTLKGRGKAAYNQHCISCHGPDLQGNGIEYPPLVGLDKRMKEKEVRHILDHGSNMMPGFKHLPEAEKDAMVAFLLNREEKENNGQASSEAGSKDIRNEVPYVSTGYIRFRDENGYPGIKPPWGTLNAVDLNSGKLLWKVPLGDHKEVRKKGMPPTGTENYGGPVVTRGGLVFIAATKDAKIRAFDKDSGEVLWQADLPVPGYATPATYSVGGKQYLVIACGGGKLGSESGDEYIAFALPDR